MVKDKRKPGGTGKMVTSSKPAKDPRTSLAKKRKTKEAIINFIAGSRIDKETEENRIPPAPIPADGTNLYPIRPRSDNSYFSVWVPYETAVAVSPAAAAALLATRPDYSVKLRAFIQLRAKHTFAELIHDYGKRFFDSIFTTPARRNIIITRLFSYVDNVVLPDADRNAYIADINDTFYPNCTTDAAAKKLVSAAIDRYLSTHENVSSINAFASEPFSTDDENSLNEFYAIIRDGYDAPPDAGSGNASFYLESWSYNLLDGYSTFRKKLAGINKFCKDLAYEADPGSGWNPPISLYTTVTNINPQYFPAKYTGLGEDLRIENVPPTAFDRGYIRLLWVGRGYPLRVYSSSNSVDKTANVINDIFIYSTALANRTPDMIATLRGYDIIRDVVEAMLTWPQNDDRFLTLICDIMLSKTAGDRIQNYAINSTLWDMLGPNNPIEIINDELCEKDANMYKGSPVIRCSAGNNVIHQPNAIVDVVISDIHLLEIFSTIEYYANQGNISAIPDSLRVAHGIFAADPTNVLNRNAYLTQLSEYIRPNIGNYSAALIQNARTRAINYFIGCNGFLLDNSVPRFSKNPRVRDPAPAANELDSDNSRFTVGANRIPRPAEDTVELEGEANEYVAVGMKATKFIAGTLVYIIDLVEKFNILDQIEDKIANIGVFNNMADDMARAVVANTSISTKYMALVSDIEMYKYTDLYSIYSQKISYNRIANSVSMFEANLRFTQGFVVDYSISRYLIFAEIRKTLRSSISVDIHYDFISILLTIIIYDLTRPTTPSGPRPAAGDASPRAFRARITWAEIDVRSNWINTASGAPNSPLRQALTQVLYGNLRGRVTISGIGIAAGGGVPAIPAGVYEITGSHITVGWVSYDLTGRPDILRHIYNNMIIDGTTFSYDNIKQTIRLSGFALFLKSLVKSMISPNSVAIYDGTGAPIGANINMAPLVGIDVIGDINGTRDAAEAWLEEFNRQASEDKALERVAVIKEGIRLRGSRRKLKGGALVGGEGTGEGEGEGAGHGEGDGEGEGEGEGEDNELFDFNYEVLEETYNKLMSGDEVNINDITSVITHSVLLAATIDSDRVNGFDILSVTHTFIDSVRQITDDKAGINKYKELARAYLAKVTIDLDKISGILANIIDILKIMGVEDSPEMAPVPEGEASPAGPLSAPAAAPVPEGEATAAADAPDLTFEERNAALAKKIAEAGARGNKRAVLSLSNNRRELRRLQRTSEPSPASSSTPEKTQLNKHGVSMTMPELLKQLEQERAKLEAVESTPADKVKVPVFVTSSGGARTARRRRQSSPTRRRNNRRKVTRRRKAPNLLRRLRGTRRFRSDR